MRLAASPACSAGATVVAATESAPLDPFLPPNRWERGQVVVEAIDLRPAPDVRAGEYRLRLGPHELTAVSPRALPEGEPVGLTLRDPLFFPA